MKFVRIIVHRNYPITLTKSLYISGSLYGIDGCRHAITSRRNPSVVLSTTKRMPQCHFANVYLKNTQRGTAADAQGKYYLQLNDPGVIDLVFTAVGI